MHMGELTAARQAFEGAVLAKGKDDVGHVAEPVEAPPLVAGSHPSRHSWSQEVLLCLIQSCLPATFEVRDAERQQAPQV